jgi:phosphate transport system substrate-binding protein
VTAAATGTVKKMPEDFRVSIVNAEGKDAYPISSFTYILISQTMPAGAKSEELLKFLHWAIADGQRFNEALGYATLPKPLVGKVSAKLKSIKIGG